MTDSVGPVTESLRRLREGDRQALDDLIPLLYSELRVLAQSKLNQERADHTLSASGLVHEAYVRLLNQRKLNVEDRVEFFGVAANTMRRVLVDWARTKKRQKRGGGAVHFPLSEVDQALGLEDDAELLELDDALERLKDVSERAAAVVECRFFAGLSLHETAAALGVSRKTVQRDWDLARVWLRKNMRDSSG